jgi:hypothetical protein
VKIPVVFSLLLLLSALSGTAQGMAGFRVGGTVPVGDSPMDIGTDAEFLAGLSRNVGPVQASALLSLGTGAVGTAARTELYDPRFTMIVVPFGLRGRVTTPTDSRFYGVAELGGGLAFLRIIYRGDPEIARERENHFTALAGGAVGGGTQITPGVAAELLGGVRVLFFTEAILVQPNLQLGMMFTPARLRRSPPQS